MHDRTSQTSKTFPRSDLARRPAGGRALAARWTIAIAVLVIVGLSIVLVPRLGKRAVESIVHDYILAHPEIIPQAMETLQKRQNQGSLAQIRGTIEAPFPGAVLGNPQGTRTLVEFSDYACGYCRQSLPDLDALIRANPDLRVVIRELPVISPHSPAAARMALLAAEQGRFTAFHEAMFAAGQVDPAAIEAAAKSAGVDMARAADPEAIARADAEIARNVEAANRLGFNGTPSWVAGDALLSGAVGLDRLAAAIGARPAS